MKKLLVSLGAIALTATPLTVVACSSDKTEETIKDEAKTPEQQLEAVNEKMTELTAKSAELQTQIDEVKEQIAAIGGTTTIREDNSELEALKAKLAELQAEKEVVDKQIEFLKSEQKFIEESNSPENDIQKVEMSAWFTPGGGNGKPANIWLNKSWFNEDGKLDLSKMTDKEISKMFYLNIFNAASTEEAAFMFEVQGVASSLKVSGLTELIKDVTIEDFGGNGDGVLQYNMGANPSAVSVVVELENPIRNYMNMGNEIQVIIKEGKTPIEREFQIHLHDDTTPTV
ncbi:hypothetical protein [Mesoplasma photuris]|uniref:hypothetical protein n=1 Tax=Mesoplasma photuris TaxID=217731 RepID=UPI00056555DB|nr:hypothetical protein [Mesoplasma photuris]